MSPVIAARQNHLFIARPPPARRSKAAEPTQCASTPRNVSRKRRHRPSRGTGGRRSTRSLTLTNEPQPRLTPQEIDRPAANPLYRVNAVSRPIVEKGRTGGMAGPEVVLEDRAAYDTLYRAESTRVMRLCRLLLADREEALEVQQDVFLKLFEALKRQPGR